MSISFEWNKDVLYAHPGEPLEQHLLAVAHRTRELIRHAGISSFREQLAFLTGLCHDLAKATEDFQDYLYCSSHSQKWAGDAKLKSHGPLGTLFCLTFGEKLVEATAGDQLALTLEVWLAALAIRSITAACMISHRSFVLPEDPDFRRRKFHFDQPAIATLASPAFDRLIQHADVPALLTSQQVIDTIAYEKRGRAGASSSAANWIPICVTNAAWKRGRFEADLRVFAAGR
jgi:CRISPR-associated endonuclease Cas3-HD